MADDPTPPETPISLDDGTWVDVGPDGRWRPSSGERTRAVVLLTIVAVFLAGAVLIASIDDGVDEGAARRAAADTTTTTEAATTTSTTKPPDPASVGGTPPSERCAEDDRDAAPLREPDEVTLLVLNASSRTGHAGATTERAARMGYDSVEPGNADKRRVSAVDYREGFCAEAERLLDQLGLAGATVEPVPRNLPVVVGRANVVVILGSDST